jgi:hypothetical protein
MVIQQALVGDQRSFRGVEQAGLFRFRKGYGHLNASACEGVCRLDSVGKNGTKLAAIKIRRLQTTLPLHEFASVFSESILSLQTGEFAAFAEYVVQLLRRHIGTLNLPALDNLLAFWLLLPGRGGGGGSFGGPPAHGESGHDGYGEEQVLLASHNKPPLKRVVEG